jgi:alanine-synthesizing transaminase
MSKFFLTEKLPPYIFASIYQLKQQAVESGLNIIDFGMGNPDSAPPIHVMNELAELSKNPQLYGYSVTGGIEILKKAICYLERQVANGLV